MYLLLKCHLFAMYVQFDTTRNPFNCFVFFTFAILQTISILTYLKIGFKRKTNCSSMVSVQGVGTKCILYLGTH